MEFNLRRYEAFQGLVLLSFLVLSILIAFPLADSYVNAHRADTAAHAVASHPDADHRQSSGLSTGMGGRLAPGAWMEQGWIGEGSLGRTIAVLGCAALVFLCIRFVGLIVQVFGRYEVQRILNQASFYGAANSKPAIETLLLTPERIFRADLAHAGSNRFPQKYIFHSFQRLLLMLSPRFGKLSAEDAAETERRVGETDWRLLQMSWCPFRWALWLLPFLAVVQSGLLVYGGMKPLMTAAGTLPDQDVLMKILTYLAPIAQAVPATVFLAIGCAVQRRLEGIYLAGVDALFYDLFLSRLPFQSSDTVIILEALQRQTRTIQEALQRQTRTIQEAMQRLDGPDRKHDSLPPQAPVAHK